MFKSKMAVLLGALAVSGVVSADLTTGLMAYYNFDDCSVNDASGNNNNGTINGNLNCVTGTVNKALQFDGASYVSVSNADSLNPSNQLTMSFWIKVDDFTGAWSPIIHKGGSNREYVAWIMSNGAFEQNVSVDGGSYQYMYSKPVVKKTKWVHYVGVIDNVKHLMKIYINGKLNAKQFNASNLFIPNDNNLQIGSTEEGYSDFKGVLDEVRLYSRVLTLDEIALLYSQGVPPLPLSGTINRLARHTVTCLNNSTKQSITIPANKATAYDCEAKGLQVKPADNVSITINGNVQ